MVYQYKKGTCLKVSAQAAGEMCAQLEATVGLTPKTLLDANREPEAPLHNEFEWDDAIAAENYRESQAAYIIRHIEVIPDIDEEKTPTRAFVSIKQDEKKYVSLDVAIRDEDMREQMFQNALKELSAFKKKYRNLERLKALFSLIDYMEKESA